ncbi:hypothetical protein QBZ16_002403 [Prototheca wickerhamii]|uniref:Carbohydrate kinase PfkB domain-containing protein n=1 Tax=Prototheca wickerhamii TaxID=3111 RepID=A0AAD9ILW5_PROWI|nr:hypothetical protein QBZ16_002403 [Prototheca wickerhamii]
MATLGNLCVDVFVDVERQPPRDLDTQRALLASLLASPPGPEAWEVGGSTNVAIAASRLGLRVAATGPLGHDPFGDFLAGILEEEGVVLQRTAAPPTLLCHVLVDGRGEHSFCSAYDSGPWPMLGAAGAEFDVRALRHSRVVLFSGVLFDEAPERGVLEAVRFARAAGAAVFFDPGPRAWTFQTPERAALLQETLRLCHVVLMTELEALAVVHGNEFAASHAVTDCPRAALDAAHAILLPQARAEGGAGSGPEQSDAQWLTQTAPSPPRPTPPPRAPEWCVIKRGERGALLARRDQARPGQLSVLEAPAPSVRVADTVGCGDAFAAAIARGFLDAAEDPAAVLALANAVGAATAGRRGAGRNVARVADVEALLARQACAEGVDEDERAAARRAAALLPGKK